ncbi:MAG: DNA polymerase III subunit chi [Pseudomonadota bacterium]
MTTKVIFHELDTALTFESDAFTNTACEMVAQAYQLNKSVSILCTNMKDAESIDEVLWQRPADKFIPHNLFNEGDGKASPVEIHALDSGDVIKNIKNTRCLINFSQQIPIDSHVFQLIHEFVPADEACKADARKRYSQYKQFGFQLTFLKSSDVE